jgi:hypothetical protein
MGPASNVPETQTKDGRAWLIGSEAETAWIDQGTQTGLAITSAIPPVFEAYATLALPETAGDPDPDLAEMRRLSDRYGGHTLALAMAAASEGKRCDLRSNTTPARPRTGGRAVFSATVSPEAKAAAARKVPAEVLTRYSQIVLSGQNTDLGEAHALLSVLQRHTAAQTWWLGYLEKSEDTDVVFANARRTAVYVGWDYVLIAAGPDQAAVWRRDLFEGVLPDLMFPADRSWLVSRLWDDDWRCVGGSGVLVAALEADVELGGRVRRIATLAEDATPPGHTAI